MASNSIVFLFGKASNNDSRPQRGSLLRWKASELVTGWHFAAIGITFPSPMEVVWLGCIFELRSPKRRERHAHRNHKIIGITCCNPWIYGKNHEPRLFDFRSAYVQRRWDDPRAQGVFTTFWWRTTRRLMTGINSGFNKSNFDTMV